jgi:EAL and modified HD-GYP domain-containing signal transduction protein
MKLFFVPVPIFNENMGVDAYYVRFKNADNLIIGDQGAGVLDGSINPKLLEMIDEVGVDTFTQGKQIFIPFSNITLIADFTTYFKTGANNIVIVIDSSVTGDSIYVNKIKESKALGYKFAFNFKSHVDGSESILELMDYIIVNQSVANKKDTLEILGKYSAVAIASHVSSYNTFNLAKATGYKLFEGRFYRVPVASIIPSDVNPLKILAVQLLNAVREDNFELDEVARIVEKDIALTVSLLSHINAQRFGSQIKTIQHAAAMLGQKELRKWVSTAASTQLGSDKPSAINKISLMRAKFAENLAPLFDMRMHADTLFLMGLFSVIDVMLDISMDEALTRVAVSDNIKDALVKHTGPFYSVYEFINFYEAADWTSVSRFLILYGIDSEQVYEAYLNTVTWYRDLMQSIGA